MIFLDAVIHGLLDSNVELLHNRAAASCLCPVEGKMVRTPASLHVITSRAGSYVVYECHGIELW